MIITVEDLGKRLDDHPDLKRFPIIDIHSHTFNARYLPIRNIARSRRFDALPLGLGYLFPDDTVVKLGNIIVRHTQLADPDGAILMELMKVEKEGAAPAVEKAVAADWDRIARELAGEDSGQKDILRDGNRPLSVPKATEAQKQKANRAAQRLFGDVSKAHGRSAAGRGREDIPEWWVARFIHFLMLNERQSRAQLTRQEFPEIDLFVDHMMDLGPVYGQKPEGEYFLDFQTEQVRRVEAFDRESDGKFIPFVAFSPYRAKTEAGINFERAWKPVEEALKRGAWGVKFYPPSGYRPTHNDIPWRWWWVPTLSQQWKARYAGFSDTELDALMLKFFERCVERDIPVFAHCGYGEFQAAGGYGPYHADPQYWVELLEKNPQLRTLRLCLGHAGGGDYWFAEGKYQRWGREVVKLCTNYPNVYCEFGATDGIAAGKNQTNRVIFANRVLECTTVAPEFGKKIMYGSDWFMPMAVNPRTDYLNSFRSVFLTPQLNGFYRDFFSRNAIRFLNLDAKRIEENLLLTEAGKTKLKELLRRAVE